MAPFWPSPPNGAPQKGIVAKPNHRQAKLPVLTCEQCGRQTVIPFRTMMGTGLLESYWPDGEHLPLVYDRCAHLQQFLYHQITWIKAALPAKDRGFWRVQIRCDHPLCDGMIVAHIQTFSQTSRSALGVAIAYAKPTSRCALGHGPASVPYPVRVDFIEWSGGEEYTV